MTDASATLRSDLPPLRIHHLLLCTAVAAVLLTVWQVVYPPEARGVLTTSVCIRLGLSWTIYAVGLTLATLTCWWRVKGYASLAQPGQWLLLVQVIPLLDLLVASLSRVGVAGQALWEKNIFLWGPAEYAHVAAGVLAPLASIVLPILLFGWTAWRIADTRPWRIVLALLALVRISGVGWSILVFAVVWPTVDDAIRKRRRSWTHWAGTGLFVAGHLVHFAGVLSILLAR
jgi:hypothetical protein